MMEQANLKIFSAGVPKLGLLRCAEACFGPVGYPFQLDFSTAPEIAEHDANGTTHEDVLIAPTAVIRTNVT